MAGIGSVFFYGKQSTFTGFDCFLFYGKAFAFTNSKNLALLFFFIKILFSYPVKRLFQNAL